MAWTKGTVTGRLKDSKDGRLEIEVEGKEYPKVIYVGQKYEGTVPDVGAYATFEFATAPPREGRKYGSSYLDGWSPAAASANGSARASAGGSDDREARIEAGLLLKVAARFCGDELNENEVIEKVRRLRAVYLTVVDEVKGVVDAPPSDAPAGDSGWEQ